MKVPNYVIFAPETGVLKVYQLDTTGHQLREPDTGDRYWITQMNLSLGSWQGTRENRTGYWLRWWDENGNLLLWGSQRAERLPAQLRAAGLEPEF